jgi:hypothetical protein
LVAEAKYRVFTLSSCEEGFPETDPKLTRKPSPLFDEPQAESTEYAEGYVMQALQTGYKVGSQTIRAALVVVSMGPGPEGGAAPPAEEAEEKSAEE